MRRHILYLSIIVGIITAGDLFSQSANLSGTIFTNNNESNVRTGGLTIDIQLSSALWAFDLGDADNSSTIGLIEGFSGDQNWSVVTDALNFNHVERVSGTLARITLPVIPDYYIPADETIKLRIPPASLVFTLSSIDATPEIKIADQSAVIGVSGSIQDGFADNEIDIREGNSDIILTVKGDVWEPDVGNNSTATANLIEGITGSSSWNNDVVPAILGSDQGASNVNLSGAQVTISIPAVGSYQISSDDVLSIDVPAQALQYTSSGSISAEPEITVVEAPASATINDPGLTESNLDGAQLTLTLIEESFKNPSLQTSNFTHNGPGVISVDDVNFVSSTEATITLGLNGDLASTVNDFQITVSGDELEGGVSLTTNGIVISAQNNPEITGVTIEENTYGIGDTVFVLITVVDDQGAEYSYSSGTVAGRSLEFLERESSTLYRGGYVVLETDQNYSAVETIPVTDLQLSSGPLLSNQYNGSVDNNTVIDTEAPVINYLQAPSGTKIVGDLVDIIVSADGSSYTANELQTRVNNVPITSTNVSFIELGSGVYILRYQVEEGDDDVSPGTLTASLQVSDQAGNLSEIVTSLTSNTTTIDANSPKVNTISVDDGVYNVGDVIEVSIEADGSNYSATNDTYVNGVPLSSSALTFSNVSGSQYRLLYTVRSVDPEVLPGNLEVVVYLRDAAGNIGQPYSEVEPNSLAIYTALPSAILTGNQDICEGDEATLTVSMTGRSPWTVYVFNGDSTIELSGINSSPHDFNVSPINTTTYRVDSVFDVNGTKNSGTGTAEVTVNQKTPVEFINLNSSYYIEADPVTLEANPSGGTFSGPGVDGDQFDPGVADTINSPHTLYYTYVNGFGCTSMDSALVFVLGAQGDIFIPRSVYCDYDDPFTVSASNVSGVTGSFRLLDSEGLQIDGLTDNGDNTATVDPTSIPVGNYTVEYAYFDEVMFYLDAAFSIEEVQEPEILAPEEEEFCQNAPQIPLSSSIAGATFEGPGVYGNAEDGFIFIPDSANVGNNTLTLTNTTENGCMRSVSKTLDILPIPDVDFSVDKLCVSSRDTVFFTNTTVNKNTISAWQWFFDDPESEEEDTSTLESPYHIFDKPGARNIILIGETEQGCVDTLEREIQFGDNPKGTFTWDNECFVDGQKVTFTSEMTSSSPINTYEWTFIESFGDPQTISGDRTIEYTFDEMDTYVVRLYAETDIGCNKKIERKITLKPTIKVTDEDIYQEAFTGGNGWWSQDEDYLSDHLSWNYNTVDFENMNGESSGGWYTQLPEESLYEYSWVNSPCFDFSDVDRPMISMEIYRSLINNIEGVSLQAKKDGEWETVGRQNSGINWYNSSRINPGPAGMPHGWTGEDPFQADNGWIEARHDLDEYAGDSLVQFRIVFTSENDSILEGREGFAFDDVRIENRNKKVLLEHFTNTSSMETRDVNGVVNNLYNTNYLDLVKLEYHTAFPGDDPFNAHNSAVPAARSFYYGVSQVPYSLLDGGYEDILRFDYKPEGLAQNDIKQKSLSTASFDIDINATYSDNQVTADVDITAREVQSQAERIVHVAVYEKLITGIATVNGATNYLNVVKTMLPNGAGTAIFDGWNLGQTRSYQFTWDYENVYDPEMIRVAAFIQNDETKEVYQVVTDDTTNLTTSIRETGAEQLQFTVYPNPASDELYLKFSPGKYDDHIIEIMDPLGRIVLSERVYAHEQIKRLDIEGIQKGMYFLRVRDNSHQFNEVQQIVIMK